MAHLQIELIAERKLKRKDLLKMGEMIVKAAKDKKVDAFILTVTNKAVGSVQIPFPITEEK